MYKVGIIQGRLSLGSPGAVQFFPQDWEAEFPLAKKMGFSSITWFLDRTIPGLDPIHDIWGKPEILAKIDAAQAITPLHAIDCGHLYPMFGPESQSTLEDFSLLLPVLASRLTDKIVIMPLLLQNAPHTPQEKEATLKTLKCFLDIAEPLGLRVALETEMPANELREFVEAIHSPAIGVCYDLGSCTAYGFDCPADIRYLEDMIFEIHLKDHKREHVIGKDASVMLGTGDTDFNGCFTALKDIHYTEGFTMQAWRGKDYLTDATTQLNFITKNLDQVYEL